MKLLNPTVGDLVEHLMRYCPDPDATIGCHSMGNGVDVRFYQQDGKVTRVQLVGFNEGTNHAQENK